MKLILVLKYFLFLITAFPFSKVLSQSKDLGYHENKFIDYHIQIDTRLTRSLARPYDSLKYEHNDSIEYFIEKLDTDFTHLITSDPKTLNYSFKKLVDSHLCQITTSVDGNFRVYDLVAWQLRTEIYQWRGNGKVFTKVFRYPKDSSGHCGNIFTVTVNGKPHYLPVTGILVWPEHSIHSIAAWRINGKNLEPVKLFKNKSEQLDRIDVPISFANFMDKDRDRMPYITYDDKEKKVYIPFVNGMEIYTNSYFIYELKGGHLEFTRIGPRRP